MMKRILAGSAAALFLGLLSAAAQAAPIVSGSVWIVAPGSAQNAIPANVPATPPDVTFRAPSDPLSFDSRGNPATDYNLLNFLLTGGAFNIVEHTAGALMNTTDNHLYEFLGQVTVTNGQNFNVLHDDGLTLIIGGLSGDRRSWTNPADYDERDIHGPDRYVRFPVGLRRVLRSASSSYHWNCPLLPRFPSLARCC